MRATVYRKEHFNAAHRLFNPNWSEERNAEIFGKCNNPNWHGHNYDLVVKITGEQDPDTGFVFDMKKLSDVIKVNILEKLDHKNLNLDVDELKNTIPTTENIARIIWEILRKNIESKYELKVLLYETERNYVEYPA